jgi:hypothetical protein
MISPALSSVSTATPNINKMRRDKPQLSQIMVKYHDLLTSASIRGGGYGRPRLSARGTSFTAQRLAHADGDNPRIAGLGNAQLGVYILPRASLEAVHSAYGVSAFLRPRFSTSESSVDSAACSTESDDHFGKLRHSNLHKESRPQVQTRILERQVSPQYHGRLHASHHKV